MRALRIKMWVGASFGVAYVLANAGRLPASAADALRVAAVAAVAALAVFARRVDLGSTGDAAPARFGRACWTVVAVEAVAIVAGVMILSGPLGAPQAGVAWVSTVVGVHFLELARVWSSSFTRRLGIAITMSGVAGLAVATAGGSAAEIAWLAGIVPGVLLLASAYAPLDLHRRRTDPNVSPAET